jgi:hypothetical protein
MGMSHVSFLWSHAVLMPKPESLSKFLVYAPVVKVAGAGGLQFGPFRMIN